jgi:hypothetical protein
MKSKQSDFEPVAVNLDGKCRASYTIIWQGIPNFLLVSCRQYSGSNSQPNSVTDWLTVCDRSLREGVIVDWMLAHGLIENRWRDRGSIRQHYAHG